MRATDHSRASGRSVWAWRSLPSPQTRYWGWQHLGATDLRAASHARCVVEAGPAPNVSETRIDPQRALAALCQRVGNLGQLSVENALPDRTVRPAFEVSTAPHKERSEVNV